jgi:hypothetical protein
MTPIEIKHYLLKRKRATLKDIAIHFRTETATIMPMLDLWIQKGNIKKYATNLGCQKGCCKCDPAFLETYEWIA